MTRKGGSNPASLSLSGCATLSHFFFDAGAIRVYQYRDPKSGK